MPRWTPDLSARCSIEAGECCARGPDPRRSRTFEVLDRGLPGPHAYDVVFRHALDIDETGDRLAFGSTTGSLWISENQGDSWLNVSRHLPPVHAVRFV